VLALVTCLTSIELMSGGTDRVVMMGGWNRASDQAEGMMDSLQKAVSQCSVCNVISHLMVNGV
jgi:hypothetical protein